MPRARWLLLCLPLLGVGGVRPAAAEFVLARDGRSDVTIHLDRPASPAVAASVDTLRRYIAEISGAELPPPGASREGGPRIVVEIGAGRDPRMDAAGLGRDGFRIRTDGGDLVFTALTADGFSNAVYTFLETYLGCRKFTETAQLVPRRREIRLPEIDDTQIPPLAFRMQDIHDPTYVAWHKLDTNESFGSFVHTFRDLVPPEKHFDAHPEYFSLLNGRRTPEGQLCLTNPDVFDLVVAELRARMAERPEATFWSVSQNDTYAPCECDACRALDEVAGSRAGSILAFVNRVADAFPDKTISTLAYQYSRRPPRNIVPRPNVNIMLCSIECNRSRPLALDPGSASFVRDVRGWGELTDNIFLWDYVIQFRNLVSPFPNLRVLQPNIRFFVESGITSVFEQGLPVMRGEFAELRIYLLSKLLWDPYLDIDAVMDDFLAGYYGAAAPHIREYIDVMHDALEASGEDLSIYGYPDVARGYLAPDLMTRYDALFARAERVVADDPVLLRRARTAGLPVRYARLEQAKAAADGEGGCFTRAGDGRLTTRPGVDAQLALFVERCEAAEIPRLWEHGIPPAEYLASTRRFLDESARPHLALGRPVALHSPASPKYHGGETAALTDGVKGWGDYRYHWLGFEGVHMTATVDLGASRTVSRIDTDFLQDINSWVFMPLEVTFSLSEDGRDFREIGRVANATSHKRWGPVIAPFGVDCEPSDARYVRVEAISLRTCPAWHKGAGGPSWIFIDEIAIR